MMSATTAAAVMASGNSGIMGDADARGLALTKDNAPTIVIADSADSNARITGSADFIRSSSLRLMNYCVVSLFIICMRNDHLNLRKNQRLMNQNLHKIGCTLNRRDRPYRV